MITDTRWWKQAGSSPGLRSAGDPGVNPQDMGPAGLRTPSPCTFPLTGMAGRPSIRPRLAPPTGATYRAARRSVVMAIVMAVVMAVATTGARSTKEVEHPHGEEEGSEEEEVSAVFCSTSEAPPSLAGPPRFGRG